MDALTPNVEYFESWDKDIRGDDDVNIAINPFKPNGFFHSYYLEKSILHFRGVRLIFSSLA